MSLSTAPCTTAHLPALLALQAEALQGQAQSATLRRNSPQMLARCLAAPHLTLGAWHGQQLAAIAILYQPHPGDPEDLAPLLLCPTGLASANFKLCIVAPAWRGQGLQRRLGLELEQHARRRGLRQLCATVSPLNQPSLHNLLQLGYSIDHTLQKYGAERLLMSKTL